MKLGEILPENGWFCNVNQWVVDFSGATTYVKGRAAA
jgi:hypothetical protein